MTKVAYIAVALLLLGGCTTQSVKPIRDSVSDTSQWEQWSAKGRIGIAGVPQSGSASFDWNQSKDITHLQLRGPIGSGSMSIVLDDTLHITSSNGTHYDAERALTELESRLGVAVPVQQMRYWLRGMPAPGQYQWLSQNTDNQSVLDQGGWRITFEFEPNQSNTKAQLPKKIAALHDQVRIKIVVQGWSYNEQHF